jgi:ParB/RepB/Spo0J family partition protein
VKEATVATGPQTAYVSPKALSPHPANPRGRDVGDVGELTASITTHGVLQPLLVVPVDQVAPHYGDPGGTLATTDYVVVAGHRRRHAATRAGADQVPVIIKTEMTPAEQVAAMLHENGQRVDLSPLAEARAYQQLATLGLTQRQIAEAGQCSQSHVSKRLTLLTLPEQAQAALAAEQITVADALTLADTDDEEIMLAALALALDSDWLTIGGALNRARRDIGVARARAASLERAEREGLKVIDPYKLTDAWKRRLAGRQAITAARKAGTLVAGINVSGEFGYYTTADPDAGDSGADEQRRLAEERSAQERHRRHAVDTRVAHCAALIRQWARRAPTGAEVDVRRVLAGRVLAGQWEWSRSRTMAARWLAAAGVGPAEARATYDRDPALGYTPYLVTLGRSQDRAVVELTALAVHLAQAELTSRSAHREWGEQDIAYLELLAGTGYRPSDWEATRLAEAKVRVAAESGRTLVDALADDDHDVEDELEDLGLCPFCGNPDPDCKVADCPAGDPAEDAELAAVRHCLRVRQDPDGYRSEPYCTCGDWTGLLVEDIADAVEVWRREHRGVTTPARLSDWGA